MSGTTWVEVYGGQISNFGDQLMLERTTAELTTRIPGMRLAMYPRDLDWSSRAAMGLHPILPGGVRPPRLFDSAYRIADRLAPAGTGRALERYGLVAPHQISGLVTLSGFAFSDVWPQSTANAARVFQRHKRRGTPIVLLPQSMGPFADPNVREHFRSVADAADLILVRDETSMRHALEVIGPSSKVRRAWDITLIEERENMPIASSSSQVSVVPNARMIDRASHTWRSRYVDVMHRLVHRLEGSGVPVQIIVHGTEAADVALATEIVGEIPGTRVRTFRTARDARNAISRSHLLIGSRFHSLVGAFAFCVPSIGIGWAHKYQDLYADFGQDAHCVGESEDFDSIWDKVERLCEETENSRARLQIEARLTGIGHDLAEMWDAVADVLTGVPNRAPTYRDVGGSQR